MQNVVNNKPQQETPIVRARYEFLKNEIARWQEENILNRAQGDEIMARYSIDGGLQHGLAVLLITGACAVGCAILLFISSNWQGVNYQAKSAAVMLAMIACYIAGWKLKGKSQLKNLLAETLIFLGCMLFGGGANLVAQHFQVTGRQPELLLWAMGIAPLVIIFRSQPAAILMAIIVSYRAVSFTTNPSDWFTLLAAASSFFCTYYVRSPWALFFNLGSLAAIVSVARPRIDEYALLFYGISCFTMHLWHQHSKRWQVMSLTYLLVSFGLVLMSGIGIMNEYSSSSVTTIQRLQIYAIASLALLTCLVKSPAGKTRWAFLTGLSVVGAVILSCNSLNGNARPEALFAFFSANLFYLFYFTSSIENRIIQFIPVATLTMFAFTCFAAAPGGAMTGSLIAFGVGLVLMICSFVALGRSFNTRAKSERNLS